MFNFIRNYPFNPLFYVVLFSSLQKYTASDGVYMKAVRRLRSSLQLSGDFGGTMLLL